MSERKAPVDGGYHGRGGYNRGGAGYGYGRDEKGDWRVSNSASHTAPLRDEPVSGPAENWAVEEHAGAELWDYRPPYLIFDFDWELPSLLQNILPRRDAHAVKEYVLGAITLVAKSDFIELKTCRQYLEKYHPSRGLKVVEAILEALDSHNGPGTSLASSFISRILKGMLPS